MLESRALFSIKTRLMQKKLPAEKSHDVGVGKWSVGIYEFLGRPDDDSSKMFDLVVDESITVPEFKAQIAAKMEDLGQDLTGKFLRVCEMGHSVMIDSDTLLGAVISFNGAEQFGVTLLDEPEPKRIKYKQAIGVAVRFHPTEYRLDDEHIEFLIDDTAYVDEWTVKEKIALATGNAVPYAHMAVAVPCMARLPYGEKLTNTVADVDKVDWSYRHGALHIKNDHVLFYFKDEREREKVRRVDFYGFVLHRCDVSFCALSADSHRGRKTEHRQKSGHC
eukprot:SAG31_NODE_418_length_15893_cov_5.433899_10_plen_277_part_00